MFGYIFAFAALIGASQGSLLIFFLFRNKRGNQKANRYLALAIIIATITVFFEGLTNILGVDILPFSIFYTRTLEFAEGPLFYFYVKLLVAPEERIRPRDCLHFIPLVVAYTAYTLVFGISGKEVLSGPFEPNRVEYRVFAAICLVFLAQLIIYLSAMQNRIRRHNEKIKETFSSIEHINLRWLKKIVDFGISFTLALLLGIFAWMALSPAAHGARFFPILFRGIIGVMPAALIMLIGYNGLSQSEIFTGAARASGDETSGDDQTTNEMTIDGTSARAAKGAATLLPQEKLDDIYEKLENAIQRQKVYLNHELTLDALARALKVNRNHLSQTINRVSKKNFYDYINSYRVGEVKRQFDDDAHARSTIIDIAFNCGFNSKTAFNEAFKKSTGLTPSEYRSRVSASRAIDKFEDHPPL